MCALAMLTGPVAAQDVFADAAAPRPAVTQYLSTWIAPNITLDEFLQRSRGEFLRADANGDGVVSADDVALHDAMFAAGLRASATNAIMKADLDGDGVVTEEELRQKLRYDQQLSDSYRARALAESDRHVEQELARLMAADIDKDGRITWNEAAAYIRAQLKNMRASTGERTRPARQILALAQSGKDLVAFRDLEPAAEALFRVIDADRNGAISLDELTAWRGR
jgi:Ca2+-binding EF-hand superfamily protein